MCDIQDSKRLPSQDLKNPSRIKIQQPFQASFQTTSGQTPDLSGILRKFEIQDVSSPQASTPQVPSRFERQFIPQCEIPQDSRGRMRALAPSSRSLAVGSALGYALSAQAPNGACDREVASDAWAGQLTFAIRVQARYRKTLGEPSNDDESLVAFEVWLDRTQIQHVRFQSAYLAEWRCEAVSLKGYISFEIREHIKKVKTSGQ
ncbi:hypothetical protein B0H16DRAFT_1451939 [Mycena metata]|uniref:Uncharacterized protein n=1 Tax=Mycena metata TaxID=1033252 RepID=A0AAD7NPP1_9AGAR|nr:hypothetical protein B0H16DRAFT_1451939 [Mycena metata]